MKLSSAGELRLLEDIKSRFSGKKTGLLVGIGDDAAVLKTDGQRLVASCDMMVEGVHFELSLITPSQLGFKLVSVNVSDIYAMGGTARFALAALALPASTDSKFMDGFFSGMQDALGYYKCSLIGGDVSVSKERMTLSLTVLGHVEKPIRRAGAREGQGIFVTGMLGDSACGLELLRKIGRPVDLDRPRGGGRLPRGFPAWQDAEPLLRRHLKPLARRPGRFLRKAAAMMDISDGLFLDLWRLCEESGVGARIYEDRIPISVEMTKAASYLGLDPLRLAATGGEDYELLFTSPAGSLPGAIRIGEVTRAGMVIVDSSGRRETFAPEGYTHFGKNSG